MSSPRRTTGDGYVREEQRDVNMLALLFIIVVLLVMFVYDQWNTRRLRNRMASGRPHGDDPANKIRSFMSV
jgi:hypothetical protein